ncbi:hypothetical protein AB5I41_00345 [Sphingomonas sp. MMS24-JH45]
MYAITGSASTVRPATRHRLYGGPVRAARGRRHRRLFRDRTLGAYGSATRTAFNGFGSDETVIATDEPMASLYVDLEQPLASNVVKL